MPFIPHTEQDIEAMLAAIGAESIEDLFDEIPRELRGEFARIPPGENEMAVSRRMRELAARDGTPLCFAGGGAYEHHVPAAIWEITTRGEFYSAYTPYQAEASQGTLQVIYEYQTMMANLTGMEVSNASLYDGASAVAEAILMACRANRRSRTNRVLVPRSLNPAYRRVLDTLLAPQEIRIETLDFDAATGTTPADALASFEGEDVTAVVVVQPNYFGRIEEVDALTDAAHELGALVVAVINPTALALLEAPGNWGGQGADIVAGEGQPLGVPLSSGGPYFGILCCRQDLVRQMPGRLVGRTVDLDGQVGYTLTLQAREQHIRRAKATSNICTNQGLLVTAATIYMALLGPHGLERVAAASHANATALRDRLTALPGVEAVFEGPMFHEFAVRLPRAPAEVVAAMADRGYVAGVTLAEDYPELADCLLVCATETKTEADLDRFADDLGEVISG